MCLSVLSSPFFGSQAAQALLPSHLGAGRWVDILDPGKPLPGAADSSIQPRQAKVAGGLKIQISLLSPIVHFRMELGRMKPRLFLGHRAPPFLCPRTILGAGTWL